MSSDALPHFSPRSCSCEQAKFITTAWKTKQLEYELFKTPRGNTVIFRYPLGSQTAKYFKYLHEFPSPAMRRAVLADIRLETKENAQEAHIHIGQYIPLEEAMAWETPLSNDIAWHGVNEARGVINEFMDFFIVAKACWTFVNPVNLDIKFLCVGLVNDPHFEHSH